MKKTLAIITAFMMTLLLLTACGGSGYMSDGFYNGVESPNENLGWSSDPDKFGDVDVDISGDTVVDDTRKIIKNGSLDIETLEFDSFISELEASVAAIGGYIESSSITGNSYDYDYYSYRRANYTVRVPVAKYDAFLKQVGELGTVTQSDTTTDDVTLTYVDIEARLSALIAERDKYMELMDRAQTIEEILTIQGYMTEVNYQIESYTSQLNTLKSLVSYSTVQLYVREVRRVTAPEPETVWERISQNLDENMYIISEGAKDLFVALVSSTPFIVVGVVLAAIVLLIVFAAIKISNKRQQKRFENSRASAAGSGNNGTNK